MHTKLVKYGRKAFVSLKTRPGCIINISVPLHVYFEELHHFYILS